VRNLLRNGASGRYYARWTFTVNGKEKQRWVNLDPDVFTVAKLLLHDKSAQIEALRTSGAAVSAGKGTVAGLLAVYRQSVATHADVGRAPGWHRGEWPGV